MDTVALRELEDIVDIPPIRLTGYEKKSDRIDLHATLAARSAVCPECGVRSTRQHGQKPIQVRDVPCFGRQVYLTLPRRRFKCRHCGGPFTEHLCFVEFGTNFTKRYEQHIFDECYERSQSAVAIQEGISDTVVRKVYEAYSGGYTEPAGRPKRIRALGIDEISMRKGHGRYICVITDIDRKRVVEVLSNRKKDTVISYLSDLPKSVRESIRYVSIDMWKPYYQAVREALPKRVKVVIDRFHVMQQLTEALTKCRRQLQRSARSKKAKEELKELRWILVMNEDNLDEEQTAKLKSLFKHCPRLKQCHKLKEDFRNIFETEKSRRQAQLRLQKWKQRAKRTGLEHIDRFVETLENWEEWILNYFSSGKVTNGVVEGINNKIKLIKRRGYGYRNNDNFKKRILVECSGQ